MNKRFVILLLLAFATLLYEGMAIYQSYFSAGIDWRSLGFGWRVDGDHFAVKSIREKDWSGKPTTALQSGLKIGDRLLAIYDSRGEGKEILNLIDVGSVTRTIQRDESWTLVISRQTNQGDWRELRINMPAMPHPEKGFLALVFEIGFGIILPWVAIITAFFIGFMKPKDDNAFLACLLFLSFSTIFVVATPESFPVGLREFGWIYHGTLNSFSVYLMMRFFLRFPSPSLIDKKAPWIKTVFLVISILFWVLELVVTFVLSYSFGDYGKLEKAISDNRFVFSWPVLAMFAIGILSLILNTVKADTKDERRRMVILLTGTLAGLLPLTAFLIYVSVFSVKNPSIWWFVLLIATLGIFPLSFVYVVLKHRVFGIRLILRRGLQYALVSRGFLVIEGILIFLLFYFAIGQIYLEGSKALTAMGTAFLTFGLVVGLGKMNRRVMPLIDRQFFREAYNAQHVLTDLSRAVRRLAAQPDQLLDTVSNAISGSLYPDRVAIFLREGTTGSRSKEIALPSAGEYQCHSMRMRAVSVEDATPTSESYEPLPSNAFVSRYLEKMAKDEPDPIEVYLDDPKSWTSALARVDSGTERLYQEKALLERLNTKLIVPLITNDRVLGFISLGEKLSEEPYSREDKELLSTVAEQTAIALDYSQLIRQVAEQEKLKREIQIAKDVQERLFPQTLPPMKTLDYSGVCRTARGVGGDYYDFLQLASNQLGLALGDVSGKGISSALLMAGLQALLRSHAPLRGNAVDQLLADMNRLMCASTESNKYATFFYGFYDETDRTFTYVNAGHNPPMLFRSAELIRLHTGGMVVGMFEEATYRKETLQLCSGDILVVFTDGISEALNTGEEEFGEERLARLVRENLHLPAAALCDLILKRVGEFVGDAPQHDDMTLVIAKVV